MQVDDPPYLSVGTAVSAKYKGAFCEAKVSKVVRIVKCKVTYKMGLGNATLSDEQIKGTLRVGQLVQAKHPDKKELVDATITKIQDCSQYTVVFDDGDITTLRRTALCLKSGRHFNESETLDQLPLTHPEHFGNPVVGGRRGRRNRQLKEDSSDGEVEEENEPDLEAYILDIGRVVSVESTEKKRTKDNWFPGLVVIPSAQPTVRINVKDEYLIRSFKDGRYYTVPKKEVSEFNREIGEKVDSSVLAEAVQKALKYLDNNELPVHWEKSLLFSSQSLDSESDENFTDTSDDEPCEEKDRFVAQLYKFMDDAGTPLNKTPTIAAKDIDLHRLFRGVQKLGGYNRVTNQNKWRSVTARLRLPNNQSTCNQVKSLYKKCLSSYETFYRTLGVTMLNHTRSNKKNRGRSLIRDKDRTTPLNSPRPDKEEELVEKVEEKKEVPVQTPEPVKVKKKQEIRKIINIAEISDTNSSDTADQSEPVAGSSKDSGRPKRENKSNKDRKIRMVTSVEKVKLVVEKPEEIQKKEEEDKGQQTRSKSQSKAKDPLILDKKIENRVNTRESRTLSVSKMNPKKIVPEEDKKRGRKKIGDDKTSAEGEGTTISINIGDKLKVYYGPTHESKVTYEAKVIEIDKDQSGLVYLVHYTGWNTRYDEWIQPQRVAENLSAATKAKRLKQSNASNAATKLGSAKNAGKRGRGVSITGRSASTNEIPRSTTPSSVTSSSSRTKSPATPATRSTSRLTRQDSTRRARRISAHTDVSNHSESESEGSVSESEVPRTRSGGKTDEVEIRTYKRKIVKPPSTPKTDKRKEKEDEDTEKEEDSEKSVRRTKKIKKSPEKSTAEESEDETNPPKGRDFDLNQIRSELKGFAKAIKVPSMDAIEKEIVSSSDDSTNPPPPELALSTEGETEEEKPKEKPLEKSSSSEDIYEFKEPEPFEFESRSKMVEDKNAKKRLVPRIFDELDKSPKKKTIKSPPSKLEKQESPSPERKPFRKIPVRKPDLQDVSDDEDTISAPVIMSPQKEEDPFDKLVESPSFNLIKTSDKPVDKAKVTKNLLDEPLSLFRELPETVDDYSRDMELSDCESQTQIFTRSGELFSDTFSKSSPDRNTLDLEFSSSKMDECKLKDSDDDDMIRAQIQRVIAQSSSTDDDSGDALLITPPTNSYQAKKRDIDPGPLASILGISTSTHIIEVPKVEEEVKEPILSVPPIEIEEKQELPPPPVEKSVFSIVKQTISPALQETDSTLLESIVSQPPVCLNAKLEETAKELSNVKTGTKIADSILQKFNSIKNKIESKSPIQETTSEPDDVNTNVKSEFKFELPKEEPKPSVSEIKLKPLEVKPKYTDIKTKIADNPSTPVDIKVKPETSKMDISTSVSPTPKLESLSDSKKRRKVVSRPYIEESESDSSDSEQLIIARSDEDSQTNSMDIKLPVEYKESDNSNPFPQLLTTTDESQSQEEPRNFQFDIKREKTPEPQIQICPSKEEEEEQEVKSENADDAEAVKEEEPDSHLHSLLLCEEEIPRSPAPATEPIPTAEVKPNKSVLEMPFASAPGTSNSKSMLHLEHKKVHPLPLELPVERESRADASAVLDNTPPTTPESTISTPSGDNGDLSPNTADNESCKSNDNEPEYPRQRRNSSMKVSPYSEEDTQMTSDTSIVKKLKEELTPGSCKKRRKSLRGSDDATPAKRGRKPVNRSRQNSDSDDTSEHSNTGSTNIGLYERSTRSPRPSKYNFYVEFDPSLDSGQRIAVLQQKLSELRKTYADVKAELAAVERRRKKIRRREREALKAAKQEMACA
ncbi:AT-rich interactive domain-containing protein 4B isoform X2 [Anoplophora glabripennis]|nr:AT-rich interactive domain-containing protein 4B isoform X2 [Anoplophora glabripennis]